MVSFPKAVSNGVLASGNHYKNPFRRQEDLHMPHLLKNNFIQTTSSITIKYKWLFRLQMCLRVCLWTKVLFYTYAHSFHRILISARTRVSVHDGKTGLECKNTAEFVVWEGEHHDPDTEVIHLLTLKHWDDTSIYSRHGWDKGVETFRIPAVPPWIHIGEDAYYYLQCQLFCSTHENSIKNAGKVDGWKSTGCRERAELSPHIQAPPGSG